MRACVRRSRTETRRRATAVEPSAASSEWPRGRTTGEADAPVDQAWLAEFVELKEARRLAELEADRDLLLRVALAGYKGREWRMLADRLVGYALRVTEAWIVTDRIRERCERRTGHRLASLARRPSRQEAADMSADTVGIAFPRFVSNVLLPGRWDSTAGASLTTFFVGQVLYRYPNVHRRWAVQLRRDEQPTSTESLDQLLHHTRVPRVEDSVLDRLHATDRLLHARLPARTVEIAAYRESGYTWDEVAELTGLSVSTAKSILNRARSKGRRP